MLRVQGNRVTVEVGSKAMSVKDVADPLAEIEQFQKQFRVPQVPELPRFTGGLVGYFGYDCVQYMEPRLRRDDKPDPLGCPDIMLMVADRVLVFDNLGGKVIIIVHADPAVDGAYGKALHDLDLLQAEIAQLRVPVSSLCIAAAVPATTALRWIKTMTEQGLFVRRADPHDGRRVFVELAPAASDALRRYFAQVGKPVAV